MLTDFLVCDDIRQEVGDKFSLVGVYADSIRLTFQGEAVWPALLPKLGIFVRTKPLVDFTPQRFSMTIAHNGTQIGKFGGDLKVSDPARPITIAFVAVPFPIPGPGTIQFHLDFWSGEQVKSVPIERSVTVEAQGPLH